MNEGALRPITVSAPEGSFLNPRPPAGGGPRAIICYRTFEAVIGALARAVPERVAAAASHMANPTVGGRDRARQRRFVAYELVLSGTGARATKDGCAAVERAGAGGSGDRRERDPARVLEDVLDGYVSMDAAASRYGVVLTGTGMDVRVNADATNALRASMRKKT